uniref:glutathione peroxidase n=1 Tax=Oryzibacter oryziterrae TaxID=2766474 RepID=UPI001F1EB916|nr:glutathione peroxidase [Oryzibacter oryziterrae]
MRIDDFEAESLNGTPVDLGTFRGQVVLVVNTASGCGFTPQFAGLEALYSKYKDQGFVILGFPCNQFGGQEPGSAEDIATFCKTMFDVSFPMFAKVEVNGPLAHPLFTWLTSRLPGWFGRKVKWNFTKFLIGRDGVPIRRFAPGTRPVAIEAHVVKALAAHAP